MFYFKTFPLGLKQHPGAWPKPAPVWPLMHQLPPFRCTRSGASFRWAGPSRSHAARSCANPTPPGGSQWHKLHSLRVVGAPQRSLKPCAPLQPLRYRSTSKCRRGVHASRSQMKGGWMYHLPLWSIPLQILFVFEGHASAVGFDLFIPFTLGEGLKPQPYPESSTSNRYTMIFSV